MNPKQGMRLVALVLMFVFAVGYAVMPMFSPARSRLVGLPAPDFTLPVMFGGEPGSRMALSDLRGQVVVLDFWASWCAPCRAQAPIIDRVARQHTGKSVVVLGVSTSGDDWAKAVHFAQSQGLGYTSLFDAEGRVANAFGVDTLPTLIVVDPSGKISAVHSRTVRAEELSALIAKAARAGSS